MNGKKRTIMAHGCSEVRFVILMTPAQCVRDSQAARLTYRIQKLNKRMMVGSDLPRT